VTGAVWTVHRAESGRFPYRIAIEQDGSTLLCVRSGSAWPGPGQQVFCLRDRGDDPAEALAAVERVPVTHVARLGRKLSVVLDRPARKRCEFLVLEKTYRHRPGTYEEIFFRTEGAIRAHRSRGRAELRPRGELAVVIDSAERYPWSFPGAHSVRRALPVGDYAALDGERIVAVVERKTLDNLLTDLSALKALHLQMTELENCLRAAVVIEAQYADFLDGGRVRKWPVAYLVRTLGEIQALHPKLPVVFAGNRKLANVWARHFLAAAVAAEREPQSDFVAEPLLQYQPRPATGGVDAEVRRAVLEAVDARFTVDDLRRHLPDAGDRRLRRVLATLRTEGRVECLGRGPRAAWRRRDGAGR
jgi:hypothetical protein